MEWGLEVGMDIELSTKITRENLVETFEHVLNIWWSVPHSINKWISGSTQVSEKEQESFIPLIPYFPFTHSEYTWKLRQLVPKNAETYSSHCYEAFFLDSDTCAIFTPFRQQNGEDSQTDATAPTKVKKCPSVMSTYKITCSEIEGSSVRLEVAIGRDDLGTSDPEREIQWLGTTLLPKLCSWFKNCSTGPKNPITKSIQNVNLTKYTNEYSRLKKRHGNRLVASWTERTDPQKFVFEDIAIAAYLLTTWNDDEKRSNSDGEWFLDLGCGNGLLSHLLASENIKGTGIDVRRRGIWDTYGSETQLREQSLDPSQCATIPDLPPCQWIIGNHSDELTPWIPVLSARMRCNFFLLPCCSWDFYGKYQRLHSDRSQYRSYLDYVKNIAEKLGFHVIEDRLKIPSTKRICFVGRITDTFGSEMDVERRIQSLLSEKLSNTSTSHPDSKFDPRPQVEPVKNCTKLPPEFISEILSTIAREILGSENFKMITRSDGEIVSWNRGGQLRLDKCAALLSPQLKLVLKAQCGGLKTLVKNHNHVFVLEGGNVRMRDISLPWTSKSGSKSVKTCWFWANHPDGCPVLESDCRFKHANTIKNA